MSKLTRTSHSFYQNHSSPNKIAFQTKLKIRGNNQYLKSSHPDQDESHPEQYNINQSLVLRNNHSQSCFYSKENQLHQSFNQLTNLNFSHHNSEQCLCNDCSCGRHLCKFHVVKPDLKKSTTYQKHYLRSKTIKNPPLISKQENKSLPKVQMNSTYAFSFRNKDPNFIIKHHPQDQLRFQGPAQRLTTYRVNHPGNRGRNPYVRPKQFLVNGQFPFKNKKSTYKQCYQKFNGIKMTESGKINDQLKTGDQALFRESFYQEKFKSPNPEDYGSIVKNIEKRQQNPRYAHQFETNYDKEFIPNEPVICQAKIKLQTRYKDMLCKSKVFLSENSDFKALSSTFHALSTAPYGQYQ